MLRRLGKRTGRTPMPTPLELSQSAAIGVVESIAPGAITVSLDIDAPQSTALNAGIPVQFPKINSYLLIPVGTGQLVGLVTWVGVERSQFPKRSGLQDFGIVDLPYPLRKVRLTPLGTLRAARTTAGVVLRLERGITSFPSIGDVARVPTAAELEGIVETQDDHPEVELGSAPWAGGAPILVDPDKLLGRHLAVLGNTGSGKSCSVAGIIRWSIEAATHDNRRPNARFIVLDPNGEYVDAFTDLGCRVFRVPFGDDDAGDPLRLPGWLWNSQEWIAFGQAAPGVQRPLLQRALRGMRAGVIQSESATDGTARSFFGYATQIRQFLADGPAGFQDRGKAQDVARALKRLRSDADYWANELTNEGQATDPADTVIAAVDTLLGAIDATYVRNGVRIEWSNPCSEAQLRSLLDEIESASESLGPPAQLPVVHEDTPIPFNAAQLPDYLESVARLDRSANASQHVEPLSMRIATLTGDGRMAPILSPAEELTLAEWMDDYIGRDDGTCVRVIDLSLVPTDLVHLVIGIVARVVFESLQRYKRVFAETLPTAIVLEEAHTFVKRTTSEAIDTQANATEYCVQMFERIAREGRKFGLGLILSSQRPAELSPTVLSQCNTFLLHRIVNDKDQDLVARLVPDNISGLLEELPSLPSQQAILVGYAVPVPVLVRIKDLPKSQRPASDDPEFWNVWTRAEARTVDWVPVADDWTRMGVPAEAAAREPPQAPPADTEDP